MHYSKHPHCRKNPSGKESVTEGQIQAHNRNVPLIEDSTFFLTDREISEYNVLPKSIFIVFEGWSNSAAVDKCVVSAPTFFEKP